MPAFVPQILMLALATQVSCQIFKLVFYSIRDGAFRLNYLVSPGGMPSSHSAFVTALICGVGVKEGPQSTAFAVAFVFGAIVIYDALKLRGAVQKHAQVLNRLQQNLAQDKRLELSEMLGHSLSEIAVGILVALATALPLAFWFRSL